MAEGALTWVTERTGDGTRVRLEGRLDGSGRLLDLLVPSISGTAVLDLSGIRRISSSGVAEWVRFLGALDEKKSTYRLERCSLAVVQQLGMISVFRGRGKIVSFFAPFFCPKCQATVEKLLDAAADAAAQIAAPPPCPECAGPTQFDDVPASYFAFLRR